MNKQPMKEILVKVYGNVQGVFFRRYAEEKAVECKVTGFAKNEEDGTVEIVAQGPEENLRHYLNFISTGPEGAEVESINVQWGPAGETITGFTTT